MFVPQTTIPLGLYLQAECFSFLLLAIEGRHLPECLQGLGGPSRQDHPAYGLWQPPGGQNRVTVAPNPPPPTPEVLLRGWKTIKSQGRRLGGPETRAALLQVSWNLNLVKLCTWVACSRHKFQRSLLPFPEEPFPCPPTPGSLLSLGVVLS